MTTSGGHGANGTCGSTSSVNGGSGGNGPSGNNGQRPQLDGGSGTNGGNAEPIIFTITDESIGLYTFESLGGTGGPGGRGGPGGWGSKGGRGGQGGTGANCPCNQGGYTPQPQSGSPNGFAALAEFDKEENGGEGNGIIDAGDAVYTRLLLWQDTNHNGCSDAGELRTLVTSGVNGISLDYQRSNRRDEYGNLFYYRTRIQVVKRTSVKRWAYDVFLVSG